MALRYWKAYGRLSDWRQDKTGPRAKKCVICGQPATIGNMCQSCRQKKEGTRKNANGRKELRHVYEFDSLGLQVWVWHKSIKKVLIYNTKESKLHRTLIETAK